jgi:DDE superfamily endonuclease
MPMPPLPESIITVLGAFVALFSRPVWCHAHLLVVGAIRCRGPHTVTAVLRVMGLVGERGFEKYHRVLSRARWAGLQGAKILLGLVVLLICAGWPLLIGVDETIERGGGRKIKAKGCYRDAVRSSQKTCVKCFGLKWISMRVIVPLPWSSGPWALPFLSVLAPSSRANEKAQKRHKTTIDWAVQMGVG